MKKIFEDIHAVLFPSEEERKQPLWFKILIVLILFGIPLFIFWFGGVGF